MLYKYIASAKSGDLKDGTIEAATKELAAKELRSRNLVILSIHEKKTVEKRRLMNDPIRFSRITPLDKILFARHMSVMLKSGLSLSEALEIVFEQSTSGKLKRIITSVRQSVNNGQPLSGSLEKFKNVFSGIFINMIRVGEASGTLEENLEHLAVQLEKDYELKKKIISAMIYPMIVLFGTFLLGVGLTVFILPKLVNLFSTFKVELPLMTRLFLGLADFLVNYGLYVLIAIAALVVAWRMLLKSKAARPFFHKILLSLPLISKMTRQVNLARLSRALALLLRSGLTINESLKITADTINNVHYKKILERAVVEVKKGKALSSILQREDLFPTMISRMIIVGERTGKLQESLLYIADYYEEELDNQTKNLATVIEPILLVVIGLILGLLAVAIISPIYQLTGSLRG